MTTKDITPEYGSVAKKDNNRYVYVKLVTESTWRVGYKMAGITYVQMFINGKLKIVNVSMLVESEYSFDDDLCQNEFELQFP